MFELAMQGNCGGFERPKEKLISDVSIAGKGILLIAYSKRTANVAFLLV